MYQNSGLMELEAHIPTNSFAPVFIPKMNHDSSSNGSRRNHNLTSDQPVWYYKEVFKQTIFNQEIIFKEQILDLHRLYGRQRALMDGMTRNELDKHNLGSKALRQTTSLSQTSAVYAQKTFDIPACSQVSISGAEKTPSCFVQKRGIQTCSYPVQSEGRSGDRGCLKSKCKKSRKNLDLQLPADIIYIDSEEEELIEDGKVSEAAEVSSYLSKKIPKVVCNGDATRGSNSVSDYASSAASLDKGLLDLNYVYKPEKEAAPASDSFEGPTAIETYSRILLQGTKSKQECLSSYNYNAGKIRSSFYQLQPPSISSDNLIRVNGSLVPELHGMTRHLQHSANVDAQKDIDLNFMPPSCSLDAVSQSFQTIGTEKLESYRPHLLSCVKTDNGREDSYQAEVNDILSERIQGSPTCEKPNISGDHYCCVSSSNCHQNSVQDVKTKGSVLLDLNVPYDSVHIKEVELTANEHVEQSKLKKDGGFGVHIDLNSSIIDVGFGVHIDLNASINEDEFSAISSPSTESLLEVPASPENKECSPPRGVSSDGNQVDTPNPMSGLEAPENKESSPPTGVDDDNYVEIPFPLSEQEEFKHKVCSQPTESDEQVDTPCPLSVHEDLEHKVCSRPIEFDDQINRRFALSEQGGLQNKECSELIEFDEHQIETSLSSGLDDLERKDCSQPMDSDETQIETPLSLSEQEDLETKDCTQPLDSTEKQTVTPVLFSGQELHTEEELFRTAAECLVSISSSAWYTCSERTTCRLTKTSSNSLKWFAGLASSVLGSLENKVGNGDHQEVLPDGMDYFEAMTLKLPETKVEECCCYRSIDYKEEVIVTASSQSQPKRGRPRKGRQQRKDFQNEILPGLASLSRCQVTEDLQVIGTLIGASADCSKTRSVRHAARFGLSRGKRRCTMSASTVTEKTAAQPLNHIGIKRQLESDKRGLINWGEVSRRRRGQRNPGCKV